MKFSTLPISYSHSSYPPRYINSQFHKFFSTYSPTSIVLPIINNDNDFTCLRQTLLTKPTIPEYQIASRIAKFIKSEPDATIDDPLVKSRIDKPSKFDTNVIIHYTYEQRFQSNKKYIHQLWNQTFQRTPVLERRLIIGNRNSANMVRELVHRNSKHTQ